MPVFKAYFTVIRKILPSLSVYFMVFIIMAVVFVKMTGGASAPTEFYAVKSDIVIQSAESSPLIDGLTAYLGENANIVDMKDEGDNLKDALFYGRVDCVLTIPAGFTQQLMEGGQPELERASGGMSEGIANIDLLVDRYLSQARLYVLNLPGITQEQLIQNVANDLKAVAQVSVASSNVQAKTGNVSDTFRYMAYSIIALLIMGITSIMMAFNSPEVLRRNQCAPISPTRMNVQLFAGNLIFTVAVWAVLCLVTYFLSGRPAFNVNLLLLYLNTLVFSIAALSMAFLAGKLLKSQIAQAAVANVVSLGISFLSGVFVPQFLLGDTVLKIASFTPGYWYVKAVDTIKDLSVFSAENLKPVFNAMLIQAAFAAAFFIIALAVSKQKRQATNS